MGGVGWGGGGGGKNRVGGGGDRGGVVREFRVVLVVTCFKNALMGFFQIELKRMRLTSQSHSVLLGTGTKVPAKSQRQCSCVQIDEL